MKKIKDYLIHLLGGVTKREAFCAHVKKTIELVTDVTGKTLPLGSLVAVKHLKKYADSLNGLPADEWCKRMYDALSADVENYEKQFDKANKHENNESEQTEITDTAHSEADK